MRQGRPVYELTFAEDLSSLPPENTPQAPQLKEETSQPASPVSHRLQVLTANVQTIRDATPCIFNPSGLAARRQYLYQQTLACAADVVCLQEARSRAGRWSGPGLLTWRSGAANGQYGCEVWIRAGVVDPPLQLTSWRILFSVPRILCVTCTDTRFPVSVISAHAPHADRPDAEARRFWQSMSDLVRQVPSTRALVIGLDANADLHAQDEEGMLIGDLLAASEPGRNDDLFLEFCLNTGLVSARRRLELATH